MVVLMILLDEQESFNKDIHVQASEGIFSFCDNGLETSLELIIFLAWKDTSRLVQFTLQPFDFKTLHAAVVFSFRNPAHRQKLPCLAAFSILIRH